MNSLASMATECLVHFVSRVVVIGLDFDAANEQWTDHRNMRNFNKLSISCRKKERKSETEREREREREREGGGGGDYAKLWPKSK